MSFSTHALFSIALCPAVLSFECSVSPLRFSSHFHFLGALPQLLHLQLGPLSSELLWCVSTTLILLTTFGFTMACVPYQIAASTEAEGSELSARWRMTDQMNPWIYFFGFYSFQELSVLEAPKVLIGSPNEPFISLRLLKLICPQTSSSLCRHHPLAIVTAGPTINPGGMPPILPVRWWSRWVTGTMNEVSFTLSSNFFSFFPSIGNPVTSIS